MLTEPEKQMLDDLPVALFTRTGELVWRSAAYSRPGKRSDAAVLGRAWWEFIFPDDLPHLLRWLASDSAEPISFRAQLPQSGVIAVVTYEKVPLRGAWLCPSRVVVLKERPALPCIITPRREIAE